MKPKQNKWIAVIVMWPLVGQALWFNGRHDWLRRFAIDEDARGGEA